MIITKNLKNIISIFFVLSVFVYINYLMWGKEQLENFVYAHYFKTSSMSKQSKILVISSSKLKKTKDISSLKISAKRLNIDLRVVNGDTDKILLGTRIKQVVKAIEIFKPNLILTIDDRQVYYPGIPNYMVINRTYNDVLKNDAANKPKLVNEKLSEFDALLPVFPQIDQLKIAIESYGKKYEGFQWYPTSQNDEINMEAQLTKLLEMHEIIKHKALIYNRINVIEQNNEIEISASLYKLFKDTLKQTCWAFVKFKNQKFVYYTNLNTPHENIKHTILINNLDELIADGKIIPNGTYIFQIEDGVHKELSYPIIGFASNKELVSQKKVILIPDNEVMSGYKELLLNVANHNKKYTWDSKKSSIFWRGIASGSRFHTDTKTFYPRLAFMHYAKNKTYIDAGFTDYLVTTTTQDTKYLAQNFPISKYVKPEDSLQFRYLLDIDGHSCSYERMAWILSSNSLLMKHSSNKVQWYYEDLIPYQHYIPIAADFSDMEKQLLWAEDHPKEVQQIIANANSFANEVFNKINVKTALHKGLLQYNQLVLQHEIIKNYES